MHCLCGDHCGVNDILVVMFEKYKYAIKNVEERVLSAVIRELPCIISGASRYPSKVHRRYSATGQIRLLHDCYIDIWSKKYLVPSEDEYRSLLIRSSYWYDTQKLPTPANIKEDPVHIVAYMLDQMFLALHLCLLSRLHKNEHSRAHAVVRPNRGKIAGRIEK